MKMNRYKTIIISIIYSFSLTACFTSTLATKPVESINSYDDHIKCIAITSLMEITTHDKKLKKIFKKQFRKFVKLTKRKFPKKERGIDSAWTSEGDRIIRLGQKHLNRLAVQYAKPCTDLL